MKTLIEAGNKTPLVTFDSGSNTLSLKGIIAPENPEIFFNELSNIIDDYINGTHICLDFFLDYFNTGSARFLYNMLKNLSLHNNISYVWRYLADDEDLLESGQEFEALCKIKFEFIEL